MVKLLIGEHEFEVTPNKIKLINVPRFDGFNIYIGVGETIKLNFKLNCALQPKDYILIELGFLEIHSEVIDDNFKATLNENESKFLVDFINYVILNGKE